MFLMKYTEPTTINGEVPAYTCDNMGPTGNFTQKQMGCSGQTLFYPNQVGDR